MKNILVTLIILTFVSANPPLKEGVYSTNTSTLSINRLKNNQYHISGDSLRESTGATGDINFVAPIQNGKIIYNIKDDDMDYTFILKTSKNASFDIIEKGRNPNFGIGVFFDGHYTLTNSPSFSCKKAATLVEKTICNNIEISRLDNRMAYSYYDKLYYDHEFKKKVQKDQKIWLKSRNNCMLKKDYKNCLIRNYTKRIEQLESFWQHK